ncbi:MAG: NADH-quinone oxidoreductase subunit C [Ignavibacteria bacterium]|nr:NADH-quinone oxidoreductase subunit C [Ignavibacteria bacterium]
MIPQEILDTLIKQFPGVTFELKKAGSGDPSILVPPDRILDVSRFLRDDDRMAFDSLMCLSGVDYTGGRMGVVYHLDSMTKRHKVTLKVEVSDDQPECQSVESVWKTANWHEREAFDLFGIRFAGHPDLRRILLPDDWVGHPLRKDYELPEYYRGMKVPY